MPGRIAGALVVSQAGEKPKVNLFDLYRGQAVERGSSPALSYLTGPAAGTVLSWAGVVARAEELAGQLRGDGVTGGDRLAVVMADHPDMIPALLAVWSCDAVVVLVDPQWGTDTRRSVLRHSGARFVFTVDDGPEVADLGGTSDHRADAPPLPASVAALAYTSGSTGAPKAIGIHHDRLLSGLLGARSALETYLGGRLPARTGSSMRLSGFGVLVLHFLWSAACGTQVVVLPRLGIANAGRYWAMVAEHEIDFAVLVAPLFELLLRTSKIRPGTVPPLFLNSSGPISDAAHARFRERFGARILNCYGQTEATFAVTLGDLSVPGETTKSVGRPFNLRVRLRAADGSIVPGAGEGELECWGPTMSDGYYDNPVGNAEVWSDGWLRTGDLARRDGDGRYWIVGRLKDAVMKGGQTVYLTDVEEACLNRPAVLEAVAVRLDLGGGNEDIGLLVRPAPGAGVDEERLRRELAEQLGRERGPRRVIVVSDPLPRIGQDKPDRRTAGVLWTKLTGPVAVSGAAGR